MRRRRARIEALTRRPTGRPAFRFSAAAQAIPGPGQVSLGFRPGSQDVMRTALFPCLISSEGFSSVIPEGCAWETGDEIDLEGPAGTAFRPPSRAQRWVLASFDNPADRLLPLLFEGLHRGTELALVCSDPPPDMPEALELNPPWQEAAAWADFIALDLGANLTSAEILPSRVREGNSRAVVQVLVTPPMPCGIGACGACSIRTRSGWVLACRDGTVWEARDLPK
jgi:hypothetical protein